MNNEKYLTVQALTKYLKFKFDTDTNLKNIYLKGEISNFKAHSTGHYYFSIKDEYSKINAIMFSTQNKKLAFIPVDGMKVLLTGRISIYESVGNYQIYVDEMFEDGVGNLYVAFELLKEKLEKEGLFDPKYKKIIPKYPEKIGIVTAKTGAAVKDILTTIKRRFPTVQIYLFSTLVQGEKAGADIAKKIELANKFDLDTLIVGRGGGSLEDLWPFNEEIVARAIFSSKIPVISSVGHEIDFTISDFVADMRAPTPTAAAELAVPNILELNEYLIQLKIRINEAINKKVNFKKLYLDSLKNSYILKNPALIYENKKQFLDNKLEMANHIINQKLEKLKMNLSNIKNNYILNNPNKLYYNSNIKLKNIIEKLELLNPLTILNRGYSITYILEKPLKNIEQVNIDDIIKTKINDGFIESKVVKKEKHYD